MSRFVFKALCLSLLPMAGCQSLHAPAEPGLVGTIWRVKDFQGQPFSAPDNASGNYTLQFGADGHLAAFAGCNELQGDYQHKGRVLRISPQLVTHRDCGEAAMKLERALIRAMEGGSDYVLSEQVLSLRNPIGITLISFQPDTAAQKSAMP